MSHDIMGTVDDRACPFCGRDSVLRLVSHKEAPVRERYWIRCGLCGGRGSESVTEQGAWDAWNGELCPNKFNQ